MKTTLLSTLTIFLTILTTTAQEINPIRMGQFFEQGYGRAPDNWADEESALDIQPTATGLVMTGWMGGESKNMALWQIDQIGRLVQFGEYGDASIDRISAAVAVHSQGGFLLAGRQSDYYEDSYHSTINDGDEALVKFIQTNGTEAWSLLVDSAGGGGGDDTNQVAVDVINDRSDNFLVLINRQYGEFSDQDFRVIKLSASGNVYWDKKYSISNTNVFAQKIVNRGNGHFLILANDVDNGIPILYEIDGSTGTYETHEEYPQANSVTCFGITNKTYNQPSSGYRLAGFQDNGADKDGFIIEVDNGLSEVGINLIENPTTGNESFRDIVAHPTGYLAIGECDNRGEGQRDVWICHLDTLGDTLKVETLGGEEIDYGHSVALIPSVFSVFIAGYNNSYTIEESGNAYLGGVKVDIGLPEVNEECKVPRVLWVDKFVEIYPKGHPNEGEINTSFGILNKPSANDLINFSIDNEITNLVLYGVDHIFRNPNQNSTGTTYKSYLSAFISKCDSLGIICTFISGYKDLEYDRASAYNSELNVAGNNYKYSGKLRYIMPEHEFWNVRSTTSSKHHSTDPNTNLVILSSGYTWDQHYYDCYLDHKNILDSLNIIDTRDANIWEVHDYFGYFYGYTWSDSLTTYNRNNLSWRQACADTLLEKSKRIYLTYYEPYKWDNGVVFLGGNNQNGFVELWYERIKLLGQQPSRKTSIMPLFSAEYFVSAPDTFCGYGENTDFVGRYLGGPPFYFGAATNSFNSVETIYHNQHDSIYSQTGSFPDIQNVVVSGVSWFKYSCINDKNYTNKSRISCYTFNTNPLKVEYSKEIERNDFKIFPNPSGGLINIQSHHQVENASLKVYDLQGNLKVAEDKEFIDGLISIDLSFLSEGFYILQVYTQNALISKRIILSK